MSVYECPLNVASVAFLLVVFGTTSSVVYLVMLHSETLHNRYASYTIHFPDGKLNLIPICLP